MHAFDALEFFFCFSSSPESCPMKIHPSGSSQKSHLINPCVIVPKLENLTTYLEDKLLDFPIYWLLNL